MSRHILGILQINCVMQRLDITRRRCNNWIDVAAHVITITFMARKKKVTITEQTVEPQPPKPHRAGVSKQFYLNAELSKALDAYMADQGELHPSQTRVFSAALKAFLAKEGFWPPKKD